MMDSGRDLREGIFSLGLIVHWLLYVTPELQLYIHLRQPVGSRHCKGLHYFTYAYKYLLQAQILRGSDATPTQPVINPISFITQP